MRSPTILVRAIARTAFAVLCATLLAACHASSADTALLGRCLTGSFSSQQQAAADPEFRDIRLHIVPIWTHRPDGPWLYVEQAAAEALDKPYRQRVYRLSQTGNDTFRSDVYLLPEPALGFAGAFAAPEPTELQTWLLEVRRERVSWTPASPLATERYEFSFG